MLQVPLVSRGVGHGDVALATALAGVLERDRISIRPEDREAASRDAWPKALLWLRENRVPSPPDLVCRPRSVEEVAKVIRFAAERGVPVVPHGARSGVCGGTIHLRGGIALDLRRLDRVRSIDREGLSVEVEAGAIGWQLEQSLAAWGCTLGHYPSSIALSSVGGWIAARGAGQASSRYGKIEDLLLGLEVVLGTGEVVRIDRPARGSDLVELFCGSEGTLGVITAAKLRLFPAPEVQLPRGWRFPSIRKALGAIEELFHRGLRPAVVRLYDPFETLVGSSGEEATHPLPPPTRRQLRTAAERGAAASRAPLAPVLRRALANPRAIHLAAGLLRSCLLVLVHEGPAAQTRAEAARGRAILAAHGGVDLGERPGRDWLRRRWSVASRLPEIFDADCWVDTCEVATSWGKVESLYRAVRSALAPHAVAMAHFSHAWPDGCSIYFTFGGAAPTAEAGCKAYDAAWRGALDAAVRHGATITHHHGVGLLKQRWMESEVGEGGLRLLRAAKRAFDPQGILNPGKLAS